MPLIRYQVKADSHLSFDDFVLTIKDERSLVRKPEKRTWTTSEIKRTVVYDPDPCPECLANTDPKNVPVHPNCECDVRTEEIITPHEGPSDEDVKQLADLLSGADVTMPDVFREFTEVPETLKIRDDSIVVMPDDFRFGDLLKFVADHEEYLTNAGNALALIIDDQDVATETEENISTIVLIHDLTESPEPDSPHWTPRRKK